jgi:type II secretory ATPase GspE/PulE/Tfp pilus assembly ATPase PilB-like protein
MPSIEDLFRKKKKSTDPTNKSAQEKFEDKMDAIRLKEKEKETEAAAKKLGTDYIDLTGFPISPEALALIPRTQAKDHKILVFLYTGAEVRIAAVDPKDPELDEIVFQVTERTHANPKIYMVSERSFEKAEKLYDALPEVKEIVKGVEISTEDITTYQSKVKGLKDIAPLVATANVTDFITVLIAASLEVGTSDIHIEAQEKNVAVRFRIDGVLHQVAEAKKEMWPRIVNRFKLLSSLKINVTTVPQDGRFTIFLGDGSKVDVRVSTLPTAYGESIVMRLLKPSSINLKFEDLGIRGNAYGHLKEEVERPNGMIVTTGPTGSGKTTTLYAILNKLNDKETKIITLEDPIEYKLEGIAQSQMDKSKDYTFARGLTSILRQDPDIIMVGELRDLETAEVAIQAALTGHLVVSTIHTNSASGAVPRFLSMGVKPFLLAPALNAIVGQRLVRRIHADCKVEDDTVTPEQRKKAEDLLSNLPEGHGYEFDLKKLKFYRGKGCDVCDGVGLKGRVGIYEIMRMTEAVEKLILSGQVSEYQMQDIAIKEGMIPMAADGVLKALDGLTTLGEVFDVAE